MVMERVRVNYHHEDGSWWAESPDVAGYSAVAESLTQLRELVAEGLPFLIDDESAVIYERFPEEFLHGSFATVTDVAGAFLTVMHGGHAHSAPASAPYGARTSFRGATEHAVSA
jgi:predicted RNase H-like HicB family nuclease